MSEERVYRGDSLRVMITTAYPPDEPFLAFRRAAEIDRLGVHEVTDDPQAADVILFVQGSPWRTDIYFRALRRHPIVRQYPEKCFMYNDIDGPWTVLPGLYCSMPRQTFSSTRHRACAYLTEQNPWIERGSLEAPDLLFSFMGRRSDPIRAQLLELDHPRALLLDTTDVHRQWEEPNVDAMRHYADTLRRSKFVLCPRGRGPASYRLFETLKAGRVPVIISDDWVAPEGPGWEGCAVRLDEAELDNVPAMLESLEPRWSGMAAAAAQTWDDWFAPDVLFTRMVDDCGVLLQRRRVPERWRRMFPDRPYLQTRAIAAVRRLSSRFSAPLEFASRGRD